MQGAGGIRPVGADHPPHCRGMEQGRRRRDKIGDIEEGARNMFIEMPRLEQLGDVPIERLSRNPLRLFGASGSCNLAK